MHFSFFFDYFFREEWKESNLKGINNNLWILWINPTSIIEIDWKDNILSLNSDIHDIPSKFYRLNIRISIMNDNRSKVSFASKTVLVERYRGNIVILIYE